MGRHAREGASLCRDGAYMGAQRRALCGRVSTASQYARPADGGEQMTAAPTGGADAPPLVLHVIHRLATGGLENGVVNLIDGLRDAGFRHAVACIEDVSEFRRRLA